MTCLWCRSTKTEDTRLSFAYYVSFTLYVSILCKKSQHMQVFPVEANTIQQRRGGRLHWVSRPHISMEGSCGCRNQQLRYWGSINSRMKCTCTRICVYFPCFDKSVARERHCFFLYQAWPGTRYYNSYSSSHLWHLIWFFIWLSHYNRLARQCLLFILQKWSPMPLVVTWRHESEVGSRTLTYHTPNKNIMSRYMANITRTPLGTLDLLVHRKP